MSQIQQRTNPLGQPVGPELPDWQPPPRPDHATLQGQACRLDPLHPAHAGALYEAFAQDESGAMWTYLPYGPFETPAAYAVWVAEASASVDPLYFAILDSCDRPVGVTSYLRITPASGSIEVGHLAYSPALQRTRAATEAMYLLMRHAFEMGYRRYEWKCDSLNAPSRAAALRLGFQFEGLFRQATVYKNRSRDTAWYSILDAEWPALRAAFERWLDPQNFDSAGNQQARLSELTRHATLETTLSECQTERSEKWEKI